MTHDSHQYYMQKALVLAASGRSTVSPNPMVGCVIVNDNRIIAEGWHEKAGQDHAEVIALKKAGSQAKGSTLYVSLEPCAHTGRTPPCVDAIIKAGVACVVVASQDPNPEVCGKGIAALKAANIPVITGCLEQSAKQLNTIFFHFHTRKRPYVIAKWAMSLDGRTIANPEDNRFITDPSTQEHAHEIRCYVDAILIGAQTARLDDPRLTVRLSNQIAKQPRPVIITQSGELPINLKLLSHHQPIIITSDPGKKALLRQINKHNITVITVPVNDDYLDLHAALNQLAQLNITSILLEGGEMTRNVFLSQGLIDEIHTYLAPVLISDLPQKIPVQIVNQTRLEKDYFYRATLIEGEVDV